MHAGSAGKTKLRDQDSGTWSVLERGLEAVGFHPEGWWWTLVSTSTGHPRSVLPSSAILDDPSRLEELTLQGPSPEPAIFEFLEP
jgi:hypothetical protein